MSRSKIFTKVLAAFLVFTLTFSNFAFVTESLATSVLEEIFNQDHTTGHENVEFDAYFGAEEEKSYSAISDVNNENLAITLDLNVKDSGYLKNGKIAIMAKEEGEKLNFNLKGEFEETEILQSVEDDVILLKQVDFGSKVVLNIPIGYENEEYVNEAKLSRDSKVVFSGIYVNDKGEEIELSKEVTLNVYWKDSREVKTSSEISKYIQFGKDENKGIILQTILNVDSSSENNTLPVKYSKIDVEVPKIGDKQISSVQVLATSTLGTNGKADERVVFSDGNWGYDSETNILTISVSNEKELVKVSNAGENDNIIDGEAELAEEERYYSKSGIDTYVITYTYENIELAEDINVTSKVNAEFATFSGVQEEEFINKVTNEMAYDFNLVGETGDIVSYNINNETDKVSKAYTYVNYNSSDKYELIYNSKTTVNVSYKEIVEQIIVEDTENYYVSNDGNAYAADDIYYKQIAINKENINSVLGEDGFVNIKDTFGNIIAVINKDCETDENGDYVIEFATKVSKIILETSKPINEGNLIISNVKASTNSMYSKEEYKNFKELVSKTVGKARYTYVENLVELGNTEIKTELTNTTTKATLHLDRDSLSTLVTNENVELRIELNNNQETSDVYAHSVFEIELPEYIQNIDIKDSGIMYGEGLTISNIEKVENEGKKLIRITVDGTQNALSSGVLNNGTNIVLNTNIEVDLYTPATEGEFKLTYVNDAATTYEENAVSILPVYYSAPTGLVVVNSTTGYDDLGSVLTSIRQGKKEAEIARDVDAKIATMEIIVMNNNNNKISDLEVLGRIPFKGVKDIQTEEDLGTTIDTKLISGLVADEKNNANFTVYYSENGEATKDLENEENGWKAEVENFENIKSYLIVPNEENYEMQASEVLRFTYQYEIPAGLKLNTSIYGTFLAYYKNHTEVAVIDEEAKADIIGFTTGEGPELSINLTSTAGEKVKEFEEITYKIEVKNSGKTSAENVLVKLPISSATIVEEVVASEGSTYNTGNENVEFNIPTIGIDEVKELSVKVTARLVEGKEVIETSASAIADKLEKEVVSEVVRTEVQETIMSIELKSNVEEVNVKENSDFDYEIVVKNLSKQDIENAVATIKLPDEVAFKEAYLVVASGTPIPNHDTSVTEYNEETRTVTINIGKIKARNTEQMVITVVTKELTGGITLQEVVANASVKADGFEEIVSNDLTTSIAKPSLVIKQTTNTTDTYITEGETIEYVFTVKNEGSAIADSVCVTDYIPEGLMAKYISYEISGVTATKRVSGNSSPSVTVTIHPGEELKVTVKTLAKSLHGAQEMTVTNVASVSMPTMAEAIKSNEITHIIEADAQFSNSNQEEEVENTGATGTTSSSSSSSNITKTYKITGTAWLDENEDGMRNDNEQKLSGITARLVNSDTGVIVKSITTDSKGNYIFPGVANGNYLVIFDYDTVKYTVTTYQKAGIEANINSDAITTKVEQDGKQRNAAVTDRVVVADSSVSNIDIGFIYADTFDLSLEKSVTKITVQNRAGTTSSQYNYETLAKMDIAAKYLSSSTVYIEYNFKVSNVGEIAGYAKKLIDYIPNGMTFSSTLNPDWYTGTDGNLYTTALADTELKPGETKEIKLVLTKQMTEDNTGLVNNQAEIYEDYNIYGVSDTNSLPANKAQGENDLSTADTILTVKTGEVFIYISVIITSVILGSIVIFIAYTQIILKRRRAGV